MVQLQQNLKDIEDAGITLVGISYDSVETLKKFAEGQKVTYTLLSDEGGKTIDAYGIRNKEVKEGSRQDGIPYPGTYLLDGKGVVRAKLFLDGYIRRHEVEALIEAAEKVE